MKNIQSRNFSIDLIKFLTCPFILLIHCPLSGDIGQAIIQFGRYGVPFFLLVSGWFSYAQSSEKMYTSAKKKLYDTIKLLGTFFLAYFIMNSLSNFISGHFCFSWLAGYANIDTLIHLILFNRALFLGSTGYYPFMLIYVYIIILLLIKRNLLEKSFIFIPVLLITNISLSSFTNIPWFYYGNFLFTGIPLFLLGHWLHKFQQKLPVSLLFWCCVFLFGVGLTFIESLIIKDGYCYIGSILMAVSLLMFSINYKKEIKNTNLQNIIKCFSTYIFIIHCGIRNILLAFLNRQNINLSNNTFVILVIFISLIICTIWYSISIHKTKKNCT